MAGKDKTRRELKLDTHWTPCGLAIVADIIAARLKQCLPRLAHESFDTRTVSVTNYGDLLRILEVPSNSGLFAPQTVEITQLLPGNALSRGEDASSVLLLGDSFTNIYHRQEMEWGDGAGWRATDVSSAIACRSSPSMVAGRPQSVNRCAKPRAPPQESCRLGGFLPRSLRPFHRMGTHPASRTRLSRIRAVAISDLAIDGQTGAKGHQTCSCQIQGALLSSSSRRPEVIECYRTESMAVLFEYCYLLRQRIILRRRRPQVYGS